MRNSMLTVTFFLLMSLSAIAFAFTSVWNILGTLAFAFGANLPDWPKMVKYWMWSGIVLTVSSLGFFVCKGYSI